MSGWRRWLVMTVLATSACAPAAAQPTGEQPCDDAINASLAASTAPAPIPSDAIYLGRGDTFFMGTKGRRWGENVEFYGGAYHMKVGIYTLDSRPPSVSVSSLDGHTMGTAVFAPTGQGLPGFLPTGITFPTSGCWKVEARGPTGFASIEVNVAASGASPNS